MSQLQADDVGVILKSVTGWTLMPVAEIAVLLRIQYVDREEDIGIGGKAIQFVLAPGQCLELAEVLSKQANHLLVGGPPPGESPN
jgi:hypothetical protein